MNTLHSGLLCLALAGGGSAILAQEAPQLPVAVVPSAAGIRYVGRFDNRDTAGLRCAWSGSEVSLRFSGTAANAKLRFTGGDLLQVVIDGKSTLTIQGRSGEGVYALARGLAPGSHRVEMWKRTEPFVGTVQILGFQLSRGGSLLPAPARPAHSLEVIGDSISCGYGNEGANQNEHFNPTTENAYLTYGAIAARTLNADYSCVAWSGRKMWPDFSIPEIYDLALPADAASKWAFPGPGPDAILINLATNDFGKGVPDKTGWTDAYTAFVKRLRAHYPKAAIYLATSPMMSDSWPAGRHDATTVKEYLMQVQSNAASDGDKNVRIIVFATQDQKDGMGSDWHPSVKTHQIMAAVLAQRLKQDLRW